MELHKTKIKEIKYKIAPNGKLIAVLLLKESKKFISEDGVMQNAILLDNARTIQDMGLYTGSRVVIDLADDVQPIKKVLHRGYVRKLPTHCPRCGEKLKRHTERGERFATLVCMNTFCYGRSQSHIYKYLSHCFKGTEDIHRIFLDTYVSIVGTPTSVMNIEDFENIVYPIKNKKTRTRLNQWTKLFGPDLGERLFDLDVAFDEELRKPEMEKKLFWYVANIKTPAHVAEQIEKICPRLFLSGRCENFKKLDVAHHAFLLDNLDFINKLFNIFKMYGEKTWK